MLKEEQNNYFFPLLKSADILSCLNDLQIPCSHEDLVKPQPHRIMQILDNFLEILVGVNRETLLSSCPSFAVMEMFEYPELHNDSLALLTFYRKLYTLMQHAWFPSLSLSDLIRPEPKRVFVIFSCLINFTKFREERLGLYEECTIQSEELMKTKLKLEQTNHELSEKIGAIKLKRAEEEPMAQKFREANLAFTADLREMKKQQASMTNDIEHLKKLKAELQEKSNNNQFLINNLKNECNRLRSRIVHSPEKLKQALAEMSHTLGAEKANLALLEKKDRELDGKIQMMHVVEQNLENCFRFLDESHVEYKKLDQAKQYAVQNKENLEKKQMEIKDLVMKEQQLKRQLANTKEKMTRLQKHQSSKQDVQGSKLSKLRLEYDAVSAERSAIQKKIDSNNQIISHAESQILSIRQRQEMEEAQLLADYGKLSESLESYRQDWLSV